GGSEIMLAVSQDGGRSWTARLQTQGGVQISAVNDPLSGNARVNFTAPEGAGTNAFSHVTVGPDGVVYVSQFAGGRFPVFHSTDGGTTFSIPVPDNTKTLGSTQGYPFGTEFLLAPEIPLPQFPIPSGTLANDKFRTQSVRGILADPTRPGTVYAIEAVQIRNMSNVVIDNGEINFARSNDYGVTWTSLFTVGSNPLNNNEIAAKFQSRFRPALNDDDGTRLLVFDSNLTDDVISGKALPQMSIDAQGNLAVIWYDTRRDAANHRLDVFGATSTDGGQTFSSNYRITSVNFDPDTGAFTDANNKKNFLLGDLIGLAVATGTAYAAWTGTDGRSGNQDIFFARYSVTSPPAAPNDRYEPNDTPQTAIDLGKVLTQRVLPRLSLAEGDHDWFKVQA